MRDNPKPKKEEKLFRIIFSKLRKTRKYPYKKKLYKDIYATSHKEAIKKAKEFILNSRKEFKLLSK